MQTFLGGKPVESKGKYQRKFLIFNREDDGFGNGQEPAGHARIEVWDKTGKLWVSVQNLQEDNKLRKLF